MCIRDRGCDFPQSWSAPNHTGDATLPLRWLPPATLLMRIFNKEAFCLTDTKFLRNSDNGSFIVLRICFNTEFTACYHMEYWIDYSVDKEKGICGMEIPVKYVVEMYIDRVSAAKNYQKEMCIRDR